MNKIEIEALLNQVAEEGVAYLHGLGYAFFQEQFLTALEQGEEFGVETDLLSECWYIAGDVYDFNDAPIMAIRAYQKSAAFDPEFADAYKEMAHMQEKIGAYALALENLKKAVELDANDKESKDDLLAIEESIQYGDEPLFKSTNAIWFLNEMLANQEFDRVIEQTVNTQTSQEKMRRACAYGAMGRVDDYLSVWEKLTRSDADIEIEYSDWFYMPNEVYNGTKIWELFKKINSRIVSDAFVQSESLLEHYPELSDEACRELICDFHIYKNSNQQQALQELAKKYANWEELHLALAEN
ncbi:MAG: hypothetical protein IT244_09045 [Bacteroidia bacterium]|nr:hypothetical protein [Bacteroidia bacterium]